jgi:hypothetical protein
LSITLIAVSPAAGWAVNDEQTHATQVEVSFQRAAQEAQVGVRLVNGQLRPSTDD